jgi:Cytosine/adenosine deaminases
MDPIDQLLDFKFMSAAIELAKQAAKLKEVPIGAVVVLNQQQLIGEGFNQPISSNDPTAHAEMIAIRKAAKYLANYRLNEATLYTTLEPCLMCAGLLINARVKRLVFGTSRTNGCNTSALLTNLSSTNQSNHSVIISSGVLAAECSKLLTDFFQTKRGQQGG